MFKCMAVFPNKERYYFGSKKAPKVAWTNEKTKVKKLV